MNGNIIDSWESFRTITNKAVGDIYFWGCGMKAILLLEAINLQKIDVNVKAILVTDAKSNDRQKDGYEVKEFNKKNMPNKNDMILICTMSIYWNEIKKIITDNGCEATIYFVDEKLEGLGHVQALKKSLKPFLDNFDENINLECNKENSKIIWTCWWQGENKAPDIVRACWRSWKKYITNSYQIRVITKFNYMEYIDVPTYMIEKAEKGLMKVQYLADIIRMLLLYKYGGIWMDATVYLTDYLPVESISSFNLYTYHLPSNDYGSNTSWTIWFIAGKPGELLFRFIAESIAWYFKYNNASLFYLQPDYTISIACEKYPAICNKFDKVPIRSGNPSSLRRNLENQFDRKSYMRICKETSIHKLSWYGYRNIPGSFYEYIINN